MTDSVNSDRIVLVTGATGHQGGAAARHLLAKGFQVRALTRDPQQEAARALEQKGADVVQGDLDDQASLDRALEGAYGVFSVQNFWETGYDREVAQGKRMADAAQAAGVDHFVYSSVASAHRDTGISHFDSKWEVEEHVRASRLPYTIIRPVFFMDNWEMPQLRNTILSGTLAQPLEPGTSLQQIAVDDIGVFAAMAFEDREKWLGREVDLAGDEPTMAETAEAFSRAIGRDVDYYQVPWDQFEEAAGEEYAVMYRWFEEVGYEADIKALRREHPGLQTLDEYLDRHDWEGAEAPAEETA